MWVVIVLILDNCLSIYFALASLLMEYCHESWVCKGAKCSFDGARNVLLIHGFVFIKNACY